MSERRTRKGVFSQAELPVASSYVYPKGRNRLLWLGGAIGTFAIVALLGFSTDRALATNVGAASNMSAIQAGVTGDGIINFNVNGTLTMDANGTGVATISVAAAGAAVIQFNATTNTIQFLAGAGAITIGAGGNFNWKWD
ncbi:MAG: hypothetical protein IH940_08625 [Acidobacteria bacterium]|nr:hypothetical protein [Acidobacteriota bacterium]